MNEPATFFNALATDRETKTKTSAIVASLLKQSKQILDLSRGEAAALVLNVDTNVLLGRRSL